MSCVKVPSAVTLPGCAAAVAVSGSFSLDTNPQIAGRTSRTQVKQETKFRTHVSGRVQLNTQGLHCLRGCLTAGQCSKTEHVDGGAVSNRRNLSHHLEASKLTKLGVSRSGLGKLISTLGWTHPWFYALGFLSAVQRRLRGLAAAGLTGGGLRQ
ncbi:hypothetical protein THAOC_02629 [Thalassiosira oceanica]|uniref:Uncharacterized protein n=1 Tax=Thalassiosira oceanica TaxID=159749 RepID=K0TAB5_THAOC|nr:hypothetical protein THAOC_02629 [Thalassiosira oceanica]|eukprot:EJK75643.1 hypothetical protein THAOC_02629 [Thalassiosira oceanica]